MTDDSPIPFGSHPTADAPADTPSASGPEGQAFPASYAQERLWFLEELMPGQATYNIPVAISFKGDLDIDALRRSLEIVVGRHESLRTRFSKSQGEPIQIVEERGLAELKVTDLRDMAGEERQKAAAYWTKLESTQPFDLRRTPLSRWRLLRLDRENSILVINLHHIISDGWSMGVLIKEMSACYAAGVTQAEAMLPELPVQYADYSVWQRRWLGSGELEAQVRFWKEHLHDLPTLELPADRPRKEIQEHRGASAFLSLGTDLSLRVREWSRLQGVTVFMTLLSAFQALLLRLTGQIDVPVGTAVANRNRPEIEPLIGFFANTLVMRGNLSNDPSFCELVSRTRESWLKAHANQNVPFERIVKELHPGRELARMPLVQVVLVLQNVPLPELKLPGLEMKAFKIDNGTSKFDWLISLEDQGNEIRGSWEYDVDLFEAATMERMIGCLTTLMRGALADPQRRLCDLELLSSEEQARLHRWGNSAVEYRAEKSLPEMFEEQARRRPDAIAAIAGDQHISYGAVDRRANQLARYLQSRGAGPEQRIAIAAQRSIHTVIGLLAIAKSGAAYVPLDPAYPAERLHFMMAEAGISLLLSESNLGLPPPAAHVSTIMLDRCEEACARFSTEKPATRLSPANLAYIIFTSGSTGQPKGSLIMHFNVARLLQATKDLFDFDEHDVWTLFHSFSFDFSVWEFWGPLISGGRFVLVSTEHRLSPEDFHRLLVAEQVTVLNQTPSSFRQLMRADAESGDRLKLRHVILGGEALDVQSLEYWIRRYGDSCPRLTNMYGITETTVHVTFRRIEAADLERSVQSPIGAPLADLKLFVLDGQFNMVPQGVPGELFVGGDGLARGYLNRPDLTAERFRPDPFSSRPGGRLYATGDVARFNARQEAEFLGRKDRQVKIRGFRIELPEIEATFNRHPKVQESVVLVDEAETSGPRLIAYVVGRKQSHAGVPPDVADWRSVFDEAYGRRASGTDPEFNTTGWNSSYTGQPIPTEEMREWVEATVARILALRPARVLEIGCGTGLLLFRVAPHCLEYHGRDFSEEALAQLRSADACARLPQVKLTAAPADDFSDLEPEKFDTIILNSVAQYFPDVYYLIRVLEGAIKVLAPGGRIVLGDLRNLQWMEAFHLSVIRSQSGAANDTDLRGKLRRRIEQEGELLVSPDLFAAIARVLPVGRIEIMLKRGRSRNEMTCFRYDVILHAPAGAAGDAPHRILRSARESMTSSQLREILRESAGTPVLIRDIPNARVRHALQELASLSRGGVHERESRGEGSEEGFHPEQIFNSRQTFDPEELCRLGEECGYECIPYLSISDPGRFHMWCRGRTEGGALPPTDVDLIESIPLPVWERYANTPVKKWSDGALIPELRSYARDMLPEYMCPSVWVELDRLPLTANGKLDRRALPRPEAHETETASGLTAARSELEELLAGIWCGVLGAVSIAPRDNFFTDLGGHSLLATQLMSRVREAFAIEIPLRALFENPTIVDLAARIEERMKDGQDATPAPRISPMPRPQAIPLSFAQERVWFLEQMGLRPGTYHISAAVRLRGTLDLEAVKASLETVVDRHETLRTRFESRDGSPVQIIAPVPVVDLPVRDLSHLGEAGQRSEYEALRLEQRTKPFDLRDGNLWRAAIVKLSARDHILLLILHHIVVDGWSLGILVREVGEIFNARIECRSPRLEELKIQYADFALWQRAWLQGGESDRQLGYWRGQLEGMTRLELTPDMARKAGGGNRRAGRVVARIGRDLAYGVKRLGRESGATPFMILLATLDVLLWRYTREEDIAVGTVIANRNRKEIEDLIGFFVNTQVLRVSLQGDPGFRDALARVREATLGAYAHQDVPFEKIVEELRPERDLQRTPFFGIMLVLQNAPMEELKLKGFEIAIESEEVDSTKFDLVVNVGDAQDGWNMSFDYNAELYQPEKIERLAAHYARLLEAAVGNPGRHISELEMFGRSELDLVERRNHTERRWGGEASLSRLIEEQVRQTPEFLAVLMNAQGLTYRELNERANQLARHLAQSGVGPEVPVGICMERSLDELVALLAVLKAGGAYVPLDPGYPPERLVAIARECKLKHIVTRSRLGFFPAGKEPPAVTCLDESQREIAGQSPADPSFETDASHLAYILYTSGSTGVPKGVMIEQRSLVNYLRWVNDSLLREVEWLPAITRLTFDASLKQLFAPLLAGKTVYLDGGFVADPRALVDLLRTRERVGLNCVPSVWRVLIRSIKTGIEQGEVDGGRLTHLFLGGENMPEDLVAESLRLLPHLKIINLYGPTEATANATFAPVPSSREISLGLPTANSRVYVLNRQMCPMPPGEAGEVYLSGAGLARGYFGKPELTAETFVPNPFSESGGERLYRTGDMARYRADEVLEYIGRADRQVKVRGHRIELSEIESVIRQCPDIRDCVVVVQEPRGGGQRLAAYFVCGGSGEIDVDALRAFVHGKLPEFMTPSFWVRLETMPLNNHGKLDLNHLPQPDEDADLKSRYASPRNDLEDLLVGVWQEVFAVDQIGVNHNFFSDLGGHSLLAVQAMSRVRELLRIEIPLRLLFEAPTVGLLSSRLMAVPEWRPRVEEVSQLYRAYEKLSEGEIDLLLREE